jgi:hypothetical protein
MHTYCARAGYSMARGARGLEGVRQAERGLQFSVQNILPMYATRELVDGAGGDLFENEFLHKQSRGRTAPVSLVESLQ